MSGGNAMTFLRRFFLPLLALMTIPALLCGAPWAIRPDTWRPHSHTELITHTIYAYRQWQSAGVEVQKGDRLSLRASGEWLYSPLVGLHGPEGGGRPSPAWYPVARIPGGALLGRVGENGEPFYVGRRTTWVADQPGLLFLRINDDLLGDNVGQLTLEIEVTPLAVTPSP